MLTRNITFPLVALIVASICYTLFSYSLTAPNLILTSWQPYWSFQTKMWATFFNNRVLLSQTYAVIITSLVLFYTVFLVSVFKLRAKLKTWNTFSKVSLIAAVAIPFVLASSALSYDVFNYIFNAKMVLVYNANPHQMTALDFADDLWVRFMHNTHTPAPYGYGWTVLSLLPSVLGFGKLLLTWINFKLFSLLSYSLLAGLYIWHLKKDWWKGLLILANPLVLIEVIGNSHNDLWMLVPALASLLLLSKVSKLSLSKLLIPAALLAVSISIKLATIVLLPIFIVMIIQKSKFSYLKKFYSLIVLLSENWPLLASIALFAPLFLERSKWFLPWYSTWALVWLPLFLPTTNKWLSLIKKIWQSLLLGFSISSLYRYLPFLVSGNYDGSVVTQQIAITWIGGITLGGIIFLLTHKFKHAS